MQIKTTRKYHHTQVRMAIIKKIYKQINAGEGVGKRDPPALLVEMQLGIVTMENSMETA